MSLIKFFENQKLNVKFTILIVALMVVPIGILAGILFYVVERNVVNENIDYMQYTMKRNEDDIESKISSINMATQFFLNDEELLVILNKAYTGEKITTSELIEFKNTDIAYLERLVNSNPLLYSIRVFAETDDIQEMMPILYGKSRMFKQEWAEKENFYEWNYNYYDNIFYSYSLKQGRKIVSYITPVYDDFNCRIGIIEAAMTMENMFPRLYEEVEGEYSFFISNENEVIIENDKLDISDEEIEYVSEYINKENEIRKNNIETVYLNHIEGVSKKLVVSFFYVEALDGILVSVKDISDNVREVYSMRNVFVFIMGILLFMVALIVNIIVQRMLRQLYEIFRAIRQVQKGNLDVVIENCGHNEVGELGTQINKMLTRIKSLMDESLKREMLVKNSEIRALQNQINAHFIYNVLETVKMMAEIKEEYEISDAVTSLGKLLRYGMKWVSGNVKVSEEIEYIQNYMSLINLRFDYEIYLSLNISEEVMKQELPKMTLQPIVENAIYHGIEQIAEDTYIYIKGYVTENEGRRDCLIEITDAGKGMTEEQVYRLRKKIAGEIDSNCSSGNGIGLKNVQDRINIAFGEGYGIEVVSKLGYFTKIIVRIPVTNYVDEKNA